MLPLFVYERYIYYHLPDKSTDTNNNGWFHCYTGQDVASLNDNEFGYILYFNICWECSVPAHKLIDNWYYFSWLFVHDGIYLHVQISESQYIFAWSAAHLSFRTEPNVLPKNKFSWIFKMVLYVNLFPDDKSEIEMKIEWKLFMLSLLIVVKMINLNNSYKNIIY